MTKQQKRERIIATINDLEARNALHRARVAEWNDDRAFEALKANYYVIDNCRRILARMDRKEAAKANR